MIDLVWELARWIAAFLAGYLVNLLVDRLSRKRPAEDTAQRQARGAISVLVISFAIWAAIGAGTFLAARSIPRNPEKSLVETSGAFGIPSAS